MLIHESTKTSKHKDVMKDVREIWSESGYNTPDGFARLEMIYDEDIGPVSAARIEDSVPAVPSFAALKPYLGQAVSKIEEHAGNPVLVVNSDQDVQAQQQQLDFDKESIWRILIGGTKLSRGFTVEGLTVSYYRRVTSMHDTLTQAGRWFGFRHGYRDLVRLFIGRKEKFGTTHRDLLEAFDAIVQDEEAFRSKLKHYAQLVDGRPQMRPADIPPLVSQHLFWLKPTAKPKMIHAVLDQQRDAQFSFVGYPTRRGPLEANLNLWTDVLNMLMPPQKLMQADLQKPTFNARCGLLALPDLIKIITNHKWISEDYQTKIVKPRLRFLTELTGIDDMLVICPQAADGDADLETVNGVEQLTVWERGRRPERGDVLVEPTEPRHRGSATRLAEGSKDDPAVQAFQNPRRGALLAYVIRDKTDGAEPTLLVGFQIFLPTATVRAQGGALTWQTK